MRLMKVTAPIRAKMYYFPLLPIFPISQLLQHWIGEENGEGHSHSYCATFKTKQVAYGKEA